MSTAVLSSKFQISIPKDVREALHLRAGQRIAFLRIGSTLKLVPVPDIEDLFGIARGAETQNYRDRSTRREAGLPALSKAQ
ncbi:MAG: AbrB/MazE/SpoVT family DNA-binding domain-containing protein, partial [Polaromonas sp.]|nr:AbrB/MazE/SpoVT family DNA-binding domain-containing protein [Polaromonas sp.]